MSVHIGQLGSAEGGGTYMRLEEKPIAEKPIEEKD